MMHSELFFKFWKFVEEVYLITRHFDGFGEEMNGGFFLKNSFDFFPFFYL